MSKTPKHSGVHLRISCLSPTRRKKDAGLATKANLAWLLERGGSYLAVHRRPPDEWGAEWAQLVRSNGAHEVRIYQEANDATGEVEL